MPIYYWKDVSIDFVISFLISTNYKSDSYDLILVIINKYLKIVYYKPVKVIVNISGLAKVIINVVIYYHLILESIVTDCGLLFTLKF